jgi:uncharacterized protein YkwD
MRILRPFILLLVCAASAVLAPGVNASSAVAYSNALLQAINAQRDQAGVAELHLDLHLTKAARGQSIYLASVGKLDHTGAGGSTVMSRVTTAGYHGNMVGEDLAAGMGPAATVRAWMSDPGHRANILATGYHKVGVGIATGSLGGGGAVPFVTVDFGS